MTRPDRCLLPRLALCLMLLLTAATALAKGPVAYALDPVHTRVQFAISHAGFSHALGTVSGSTGQLLFDPDDWSQAQLNVSVPLTRLDLGDADWNRAALASNLLDGKRYPTARFVSTRVEPQGADRAFVFGNLSLHGVTREVRLDVQLNALKRHPLPPFRRTAGFSATTTLNRSDFGITSWKSVIGDEVQLRIEAEATRGARADDDSETAPPADGTPADGTPTNDTPADAPPAANATESTP